MIRPRLMLLVQAILLVCASTVSTADDDAQALHRLFPNQATIRTGGGGLCRLALPPQVLEQCRADLSDLRIFDAGGTEIPFVVDSSREPKLVRQVLRFVPVEVVSVERRQEQPPHGRDRFHETYTLQVPSLATDVAAWDLVLLVQRAEFVCRVELDAETRSQGSVQVVAGGSAFRLTSPRGERLHFPVPADATQLEVSLVGENGTYLSPQFRLQASRSVADRQPSEVHLEQLEVDRLPQQTVLVLARPRGLVPARLSIRTATGSFHRQVTVWDEGAGAERDPIGQRSLFKLDAIVPVAVDEIAVRPPRGDRLRLIIDNGDSPALEEIEVVAMLTQPVLFFSVPAGSETAMLRFGGARAHRPDYDVAALKPVLGGPLAGDAADKALAFWDPQRSRAAVLGPITSNPAYDPEPALAFAMHAGAELDPRPFSHRRTLQITPSAEGLARLRLTPEDLAVTRPDLADLRVVDGASRQWAYLVEPQSTTVAMTLEVAEHQVERRRSHYRLRLPIAPLGLSRLVLEASAPFFDRAYRLRGRDDNDRDLVLAQGRLVRHQGDPRPQTILFSPVRCERLELIIDDGDDAPLELTRVEAFTPVPDLFVAAPQGEYALLLGFPEAAAPRYELERVRSTVLAVPSAAAQVGGLQPSPEFRARSRFATETGSQQLLMWIVLAVAVIALAGLTLRLARQESAQSEE